MDKVNQKSDDLLLRYIDGTLSVTERQDLHTDLEKNEILRKRLDHLKSTHALLRVNKLEQPSKNFTQLVMMELSHYPRSASFPIRNSILLLTGVLLVIIIASVLVPAGVFDGISTTIDLNQVELPKKYIQKTLP